MGMKTRKEIFEAAMRALTNPSQDLSRSDKRKLDRLVHGALERHGLALPPAHHQPTEKTEASQS